jgi:hypothetical protein
MLWLAWGGLEIRDILGITGLWRIRGQRFAVGPSRVCVFITSTPLGWAMFSRPSACSRSLRAIVGLKVGSSAYLLFCF